MSRLLDQIKALVERREVRVSAHGYDELAEDGILVRDVLHGIAQAELVREYPDYQKGPCVLILQWDAQRQPIHVVWGIPKGAESPAVLVTAYRPDLDLWEPDYKTRKRS